MEAPTFVEGTRKALRVNVAMPTEQLFGIGRVLHLLRRASRAPRWAVSDAAGVHVNTLRTVELGLRAPLWVTVVSALNAMGYTLALVPLTEGDDVRGK